MKTWKCVTIVGVGLIGGSVGLAVRRRGLAARIVGTGSRPATLEAARSLGAIDDVDLDSSRAVAGADLIVVCAPVEAIVDQVCRLAPDCPSGTLITDAGSTKQDIVTRLEQAAQQGRWNEDVHFVGSHPLAGNEKRGPQHASADLFAGRVAVVTPVATTNGAACTAVCDFWSSLGADVLQMAPDAHDHALAFTSHLPHLVAAALAASTPEEYLRLTAGGWQDTTRIASGDPVLWRQILLSNRANVLASLGRLASLVDQWRAALEAADAPTIEKLLSEAKRIRDSMKG